MRFEAEGKLNEAQKVYDTILQEDESNVVSMRNITRSFQEFDSNNDCSWCPNVKLLY
jgi:hypothetical protein